MSLRRNPLQLEPLEGRDLCAVNVLSTAGLISDPVEVREWRLRQEVSDVETVRGQLSTASATLATLRQEVLDAEAALSGLGPVQVPTLQADGANRRVLEHTTLTIAGQTAEAWTGWERHGVLVRDGSLITVGSSSGSMTTVEQPQGTDNIALRFTTPQTDLRAVRLRPLVSGQNMTGEAWVITSTGTVIKSNFSSINGGSVPLPVHNSVSYVVVVWRSGGGYSLDAIERAAPADPVRQAAESRVTAARANEQAGLAALQPDALRVRLREEISDVVFGAAQFGVSMPTTVSSGQELVSVTPTAQAWAPNSVELAFRFTDLAASYDLLQSGSVKVRFNPGTSTLTIPYDGSASLGNWSLRNVATGATTSLDLLVTRNIQSGVFSFLKQSNSQAYGTQPVTALTGLVSRPVLTTDRFNTGGVSPTTQSAINALLGSDLSWLQNVPLTASELSAGRDRLSAGTANDEATLRTALLTRPGVEAVLTPSLSFQTGWNMTGQHTLTVNGNDLPDGSRLVLASDAGLTQVLDERSLLAGSDGVTMLRGSATFVGLVDASGQILGQPFSLANESGWLMVRQGQTLVGQPNTTLPATALAGVLNPVTKDSLRSVTPSVRFAVSGSSVDLRYEWLPVGTVVTLTNPVDGVASPPITVTSRTGNLPLYLPAGQARTITLTASDGRQLFRPMGIIRRPDTGQMSFYELDPPANRWVAALELTTERTLATREETLATEAGRGTLLTRLNAVSVSADAASRRNWGAALGELAGISLSLSEREIARRHLPTLIGANPAEDCTLILAEIDRLTALPGSNSRGWNERYVLSMVSDAYARAREDIKTAWPIFCEMIVAGFQVVQSTRTDAANVTPVSAIEQTRNAFAQSGQLLHLLPSAQTILGCLNQHFDRCHTFLAGAATTWQQEVNAASAAGSITRDPNPGLRLQDSPQQRAYDAALSAFGDAERLYRQAVSTGVARYISAASVTLERARVTLQQAEAALKGANTASAPAQLTKLTLENGDIITVLNKAALQHVLAAIPGRIASATARLQGLTSGTLLVVTQVELAHWQKLKQATEGLLALIPAGQTVPVTTSTQARDWLAYIEGTTTDPVPLTPQVVEAFFLEARTWYTGSPIPSAFSNSVAGSTAVRLDIDTSFGRMVAGLWENRHVTAVREAFAVLTDLPRVQLDAALNGDDAGQLVQFLKGNGYEFAFVRANETARALEYKAEAVDIHGAFRIRFDALPAGRTLEYVEAFVVDPLTGTERKIGGARNQLFLWVQGATLQDLGLYGDVTMRLVAKYTNGDQQVTPLESRLDVPFTDRALTAFAARHYGLTVPAASVPQTVAAHAPGAAALDASLETLIRGLPGAGFTSQRLWQEVQQQMQGLSLGLAADRLEDFVLDENRLLALLAEVAQGTKGINQVLAALENDLAGTASAGAIQEVKSLTLNAISNVALDTAFPYRNRVNDRHVIASQLLLALSFTGLGIPSGAAGQVAGALTSLAEFVGAAIDHQLLGPYRSDPRFFQVTVAQFGGHAILMPATVAATINIALRSPNALQVLMEMEADVLEFNARVGGAMETSQVQADQSRATIASFFAALRNSLS